MAVWQTHSGFRHMRLQTRSICSTMRPHRLNRRISASPGVLATAVPGLRLGLYGAQGIYTPNDLIETTSRLVLHCQELQRLVEVARAPELRSLVRQHHEAVCWLRPLADHCEAHHEIPEWREAAARAAQALQAVDELLSSKLAVHPHWGSGSACSPVAVAFRPDVGPSSMSSPTVLPKASATAILKAARWSTGPASGSSPTTAAISCTATLPSGSSAPPAVNSPPDVHIATSNPDAFSTHMDATSDRTFNAGASSRPSPAPALRLVEEGVARASSMLAEDVSERDALEALERGLVAGFQAALADPRFAPLPLVVLHDLEVRRDPLLARHATPATEEEVALALGNGGVTLPLTGAEALAGSANEGEEWAHGGCEHTRTASGQLEPLTVKLAPVAAATYLARSKAGSLWSVRLSSQLTHLLLGEHPNAEVRRAVHSVTHGSQAAAALHLMDLLRPLRDDLADCFGQPSYAHLRIAGSVVCDPQVALALLADLLSAIRPMAEEEVAAMQRLQLRMAVNGGLAGIATSGAGVEGYRRPDPLDLVGSIDFFTNVQRPPPLSVSDWRDLAPYFTIDGQLQGLSCLLSNVLGLELRATTPGPYELWQRATWKIIRLELLDVNLYQQPDLKIRLPREAASTAFPMKGPVVLGVLYVFLDPDCALPFTVLVRHGYPGDATAPWLAHQQSPGNVDCYGQEQSNPGSRSGRAGEKPYCSGSPSPTARGAVTAEGGCVPHVALHVPAEEVTLSLGGYLVPEKPGLIRTLAHELGHALHYILSYRPGGLPESNACYSSTDFLELASHILERWVADPRVLADLSRHAVSGARLTPQRCEQLAASLSRQSTWLELQQHMLASAADLLMHLHGTVDVHRLRLLPPPQPATPPSPSSSPSLSSSPSRPTHTTTAPSLQQTSDLQLQQLRQGEELPQTAKQATADISHRNAGSSNCARACHSTTPVSGDGLRGPATAASPHVLDLGSTPTLELVCTLWKHHSSLPGGIFQPTHGFMKVLPGFIHNPAAMYAYPLAQTVSAAVWKRHFAEGLGSRTAANGGRLLRRVLLECGEADGAGVALEALLGRGCVQRKNSADVCMVAGADCEGAELGNDGRYGEGSEGDDGCSGDRGGKCVTPDLAHEAFQDINLLAF